MHAAKKNEPLLSIIVIFHNMRREAARTLYSLSAAYQADVSSDEYEVIAIDNGSEEPLDPALVREFGPNFKYHFFKTESASPAEAVNFGAANTSSQMLGVIVDGARMLTPGIVRESLNAFNSFSQPFVCALAWHLGPDVQNETILHGYDEAEEDRLLNSIAWRNDGYQLFDISTLAQSSCMGFFGGMPNECSWFAMSRSIFIRMHGYDERFQSPGGGQVNHDFLGRALAQPEILPVVILGEGSFHQFHGGVATNVPMSEHPAEIFKAEYLRIHGRPHQDTPVTPHYIGEIHESARKFISPDAVTQNWINKSGR